MHNFGLGHQFGLFVVTWTVAIAYWRISKTEQTQQCRSGMTDHTDPQTEMHCSNKPGSRAAPASVLPGPVASLASGRGTCRDDQARSP